MTAPQRRACTILAALALIAPAPSHAESIRFPADAKVADVKRDYGAVGDGLADDTAAIQKALTDKQRIVYLPNGTYLVSGTLRWGPDQKRQILQGESTSGSIIELKDADPDFQETLKGTPVIWTGKAPAQRFRNGIRNLTVSTGRGNPGAIGIQFIANNQGGIHDVVVKSEDGQGLIGLDLGYSDEQGPCLIKNVVVDGFDVGISTKHGVDSVTMENIQVVNQRQFGIVNQGQVVSIRNFLSRGKAPGLWNKRGSSFTVLWGAKIEGEGKTAIINDAALYATDLKTAGFENAVQGMVGSPAPPGIVDRYLSYPVESLFGAPEKSLEIAVEETPSVPWDDPSDWVSVASFDPINEVVVDKTGKSFSIANWASAFQKAIDSGKTTVYFPTGTYAMQGKVEIRGNVRRIIGLESEFGKQGNLEISMGSDGSPTVVFERFDFLYSHVRLVQRSARSLVVSSVAGGRYLLETPGRMFIEDAVCRIQSKGGSLWARQLNIEGGGEKDIPAGPRQDYYPGYDGFLNDGGTAWLFGLKTEGDGTPVTAVNNAKTIVTGLVYANKAYRTPKQWIVNIDSEISASIGEAVIRNAPFDPVVDIKKGVIKVLPKGSVPGRAGGGMMLLYQSGS